MRLSKILSMLWNTLKILTFVKLRQDDLEFKAKKCYTVRLPQNKNQYKLLYKCTKKIRFSLRKDEVNQYVDWELKQENRWNEGNKKYQKSKGKKRTEHRLVWSPVSTSTLGVARPISHHQAGLEGARWVMETRSCLVVSPQAKTTHHRTASETWFYLLGAQRLFKPLGSVYHWPRPRCWGCLICMNRNSRCC